METTCIRQGQKLEAKQIKQQTIGYSLDVSKEYSYRRIQEGLDAYKIKLPYFNNKKKEKTTDVDLFKAGKSFIKKIPRENLTEYHKKVIRMIINDLEKIIAE